MLERSLQDKIDVYLKPDYLKVVENECELWEGEDGEPGARNGRTRLKVILPPDVSILCIRKHDIQPRCAFLNPATEYGLEKSVDHILLTPNTNGTWTVHLIEMKSGLGRSEWREISLKARASMLNMKALAAILDISIEAFEVYTTYERLSYHTDDPTSLTERKERLGGGWKENEWDNHQLPIYIPKGKKTFLWHNGVKMNTEVVDGQDTLCGELVLHNRQPAART